MTVIWLVHLKESHVHVRTIDHINDESSSCGTDGPEDVACQWLVVRAQCQTGDYWMLDWELQGWPQYHLNYVNSGSPDMSKYWRDRSVILLFSLVYWNWVFGKQWSPKRGKQTCFVGQLFWQCTCFSAMTTYGHNWRYFSVVFGFKVKNV